MNKQIENYIKNLPSIKHHTDAQLEHSPATRLSQLQCSTLTEGLHGSISAANRAKFADPHQSMDLDGVLLALVQLLQDVGALSGDGATLVLLGGGSDQCLTRHLQEEEEVRLGAD